MIMENLTSTPGRNRARAWSFLFAALCWSLSARAGAAIQEDVRRTYRVVVQEEGGNWMDLSREISGVVRSEVHLYPSEWDGTPVVRYDKEDTLRDGAGVSWTFILDAERLSLLRLEKRVTDRSGRAASEAWHDFREPAFAPAGDLCYMYTIPAWLTGKELRVGDRYDFNLLLSPDGTPIHMFAKVTGRETTTVPAGTFECFRVILEPDLKKILGRWSWVSPIISPWVPDYDFWMDQAPPHFQVRFQGRFGPVGAAPLQAYELLGTEPSTKPPQRPESGNKSKVKP